MIRKILAILRDRDGVPAFFIDLRDEIRIRFGRAGEAEIRDGIRGCKERGWIAVSRDAATEDETYRITPKGRSNVP